MVSAAAPSPPKSWLWFECAIAFVGVPAALTLYPTSWDGHVALWSYSIYAITSLTRMRGFSWRTLWQGDGWSTKHRFHALLRFFAATPAIVILTYLIVPQRLFLFPMMRFKFWLMVMLLYPILSALPQELVFRSYFFQRYRELFPEPLPMLAANSVVFAVAHALFHNWVSPLLCVVAGGLFSWSYMQHRSLKWAAIEHGVYGCMIFTIGIGAFFLVNGLNR